MARYNEIYDSNICKNYKKVFFKSRNRKCLKEWKSGLSDILNNE